MTAGMISWTDVASREKAFQKLIGFIGLLLFFANTASARILHVSLGDNPTHTLHGPAGGAGAVWNTWSPISGPLMDSEGNATSVEISAEGDGPYGDWWCDLQLLTSGLACSDGEGPKLVQITGLSPESIYDIYVICARGSRGANTLCTPLIPNSSNTARRANNQVARNGTGWARGENYVLFQDLIPDASGTVAFSYEGDGSYGILNGLQIIEVNESATTYAQWASDAAQGLTPGVNNGPSDDADGDGISNLLEFVMNGNPLQPSPEKQPGLYTNGSEWFFEYDRRDSSRQPSTEQVIEYSNDLLSWTAITIPLVSSGMVDIRDDGPYDRVQVHLPGTMGKLFVRLHVQDLSPANTTSQNFR